MLTVITIFLVLLAVYVGIGLVFSLWFVLKGAVRIDPLMGNSKFKVRLLLAPGVLATWHFLLKKLLSKKSN